MISMPPISNKIRKIYVSGAAALLLFYTLVFNLALLFTEDSTNVERLKLVAPFHFSQYQQGQTGIIVVDPLVTLYDSYHLLPAKIKPRISQDWQGGASFFFEDDTELNVVARQIQAGGEAKTVYAIESIHAVEISDFNLALIEIGVFIAGLLIFLIVAGFIFKTIRDITQPFIALAHKLDKDISLDFTQLQLDGERTLESELTLDAVNAYRARIHSSIIREKNFTRYVSHELRTPMTVIQGCVSILRKYDSPIVKSQCSRISQAISEMGQLTRTFLLLARNSDIESNKVNIDQQFLHEALLPLQDMAMASQVELNTQVLDPFQLQAEPLLISVLIQNIVSNSISCSEQGKVSLFLSQDKLEVIDNGVGLNAKPRGYEGFGIGLQIVEDICSRYNWKFQLQNNRGQGCTAVVLFTPWHETSQ